ncbi:MAG: response regulator [Nitrospirota bacterium]|nr:response regulator [Nitrospirota bacterium]
MPDQRDQQFQQRLAQIRSEFVSRLPQRLSDLNQAWAQLASGNADAAVVEAMHRNAHGLAGAGGSFGLSGLTAAARELEAAIAPLFTPPHQPDAALRQQIPELIGNLLRAMTGAHGTAPPPADTIYIPTAETPPEVSQAVQAVSPDPSANGTQRAARTILYIEDDPANRRLVSELVGRRPDLRLLTAPDPERGIELATGERPDLVLLDIGLPGMDGFQVLRCLRDDERTRTIPIVALTGNVMPADLSRGKAEGFDGYLVKPFRIAMFYETLDAHMGGPSAPHPQPQ